MRQHMNTNKELWLCLHFPHLPIEVFTRGENESSPIVVLSKQRVSHLNKAAFTLGIRPDNNMNTAYTISEQVISFERDEEKEFAMLSHLAQWAYQFTPSVAVKAPHSLLLDIEGCLRLFGGLSKLKAAIESGIDKLGFRAVIGVNRTPLSALLCAEAGIAAVNAEINAETKNTTDIRASLAQIPIRHLRADEAIKDSLSKMGIGHCKQLMALPLDGLNRRFGVFFTDYLQRLMGDKPDPQKFVPNKPQFLNSITFLSDVTNTESLVFPMKRLLGELQDFLRGRQLLINQFSFKLSHRSHPAKSFTVYLTDPENDAQLFLMLSQLQLDKINDMPEVDSVHLSAKTFFTGESSSGDLFHGTRFKQKDGRVHSKAEQARATRLLNKLSARLGQQACFGISLANDHRPEFSWKPISLAQKDYWQDDTKETRPVYLLNGAKLLSSEYCSKLELLQGPERIDFGWWDKNEISRDYYIARHPTGAIYWVYQQLHNNLYSNSYSNDWYVHGIFS